MPCCWRSFSISSCSRACNSAKGPSWDFYGFLMISNPPVQGHEVDSLPVFPIPIPKPSPSCEISSNADVASSKISSRGCFTTARATARRCFSPPLRSLPLLPTSVCQRLGKASALKKVSWLDLWFSGGTSDFQHGCLGIPMGMGGVDGKLSYKWEIMHCQIKMMTPKSHV